MGLGSIFFLTPILGWSWPALTPILVAVAGSLGYKLTTTRLTGKSGLTRLDRKLINLRMVELQMDDFLKDVVCEELGHDEELHFEKDDLLVTFGHDARGRFFIRVTGPKQRSASELRLAGEEFARTLIQQFACHRVAAELDRRGIQIVEESVDDEGSIRLRARRW
ncbi:MAG: DUF1257 domain-containing protein [Candidatus Sumerlaeia bacterium]|nr:DUF1257 domain-containing protein [Candidatus Sumerlaeia bacterium]